MAATVLCFFMALMAIWVPEQRWWWTLLAVGMTTPAATGCLQMRASQRGRVAGFVGLVFSSMILLLWLLVIWMLSGDEGRWFVSVWTLAGFAALITLCLIDVEFTVVAAWRLVGVVCAMVSCKMGVQHVDASLSLY